MIQGLPSAVRAAIIAALKADPEIGGTDGARVSYHPPDVADALSDAQQAGRVWVGLPSWSWVSDHRPGSPQPGPRLQCQWQIVHHARRQPQDSTRTDVEATAHSFDEALNRAARITQVLAPLATVAPGAGSLSVSVVDGWYRVVQVFQSQIALPALS